VAPQEGPGTTDVHRLIESGEGLVASDPPETIRSVESANVTVRVTNDGHKLVDGAEQGMNLWLDTGHCSD